MAHTAYSPHGPSGGCGAESRCVCVDCFGDFTQQHRALLTSRNTLRVIPERSSVSSPGRFSGTGGASRGVSISGSERRNRLGVGSGGCGGSGHADSSEQRSGSGDDVGACAATAGDADGSDRLSSHGVPRGLLLWFRGRTKATAVAKFRVMLAAGRCTNNQGVQEGGAPGAAVAAPEE